MTCTDQGTCIFSEGGNKLAGQNCDNEESSGLANTIWFYQYAQMLDFGFINIPKSLLSPIWKGKTMDANKSNIRSQMVAFGKKKTSWHWHVVECKFPGGVSFIASPPSGEAVMGMFLPLWGCHRWAEYVKKLAATRKAKASTQMAMRKFLEGETRGSPKKYKFILVPYVCVH